MDNLKEINDIYGHVTGGDKSLRVLADYLKRMCRAEDTLCRFGGDEFLIILHNTAAQVAYERTMQMKEATSKTKITADGGEFGIKFSGGMAAFPIHGATNAEIIIRADEALYKAKQLGRDRVVVYQPG